MPSWLASDRNTANGLEQRFGTGALASKTVLEPNEALRRLLQARNSIAVLPCDSSDFAVMATIRSSCRVPAQASDSPAQREPRQVATGFLGLVDELVWEEEESAKKSWWQKLLD